MALWLNYHPKAHDADDQRMAQEERSVMIKTVTVKPRRTRPCHVTAATMFWPVLHASSNPTGRVSEVFCNVCVKQERLLTIYVVFSLMYPTLLSPPMNQQAGRSSQSESVNDMDK